MFIRGTFNKECEFEYDICQKIEYDFRHIKINKFYLTTNYFPFPNSSFLCRLSFFFDKILVLMQQLFPFLFNMLFLILYVVNAALSLKTKFLNCFLGVRYLVLDRLDVFLRSLRFPWLQVTKFVSLCLCAFLVIRNLFKNINAQIVKISLLSFQSF